VPGCTRGGWLAGCSGDALSGCAQTRPHSPALILPGPSLPVDAADLFQMVGAVASIVTGGPSSAQIWDPLPVGRQVSKRSGADSPTDSTSRYSLARATSPTLVVSTPGHTTPRHAKGQAGRQQEVIACWLWPEDSGISRCPALVSPDSALLSCPPCPARWQDIPPVGTSTPLDDVNELPTTTSLSWDTLACLFRECRFFASSTPLPCNHLCPNCMRLPTFMLLFTPPSQAEQTQPLPHSTPPLPPCEYARAHTQPTPVPCSMQ